MQATAAAQAGVSVMQPNIGRLDDWYHKYPGVIRDPKVMLMESANAPLSMSNTTPAHCADATVVIDPVPWQMCSLSAHQHITVVAGRPVKRRVIVMLIRRVQERTAASSAK